MTLSPAIIFRRTASLMSAHPLPGLLWAMVLIAIGTAMDMLTGGDTPYFLAYCAVTMFGEFLFTSALLRGEGAQHAWGRPGRAVSFVGLVLVMEAAILLGFLLLILPGLYLYARWLVAAPLIIGEGTRMWEAMQISWKRTRAGAWPITLALILMFLPAAVGTVWMLFSYPEYGPVTIGLALAVNTLCSTSCIVVFYAAVAIHLGLGTDAVDSRAAE